METLNIFGIRADYMRQFKEYLEEEGLPSNEDRIDFVLPVINGLGNLKLKTVRLQDGVDFKCQGPRPTLDRPNDLLKRQKLVLDWYPKIQSMASARGQGQLLEVQRNQTVLTAKHLAFLDWDSIYFEMQRFKNERAWFNLNLSREKIKELLLSPDWYELYIPQDLLEFRSFDQARQWQEIAASLLKKYCDRYYKHYKAAYENDFLEYRELIENDDNFLKEYRILVEKSQTDIIAKLEEIKTLIETKQLKDIEYQGFRSIMFSQHLYQPLLYLGTNVIEIKPVALNDGERDFVLDLRACYDSNKEFFKDKELYLLRNMSKGRGIGFFEAGNFYPDFILWLVIGGEQRIIFVDPKGIRNLEGLSDPKIQFHQKIKELEVRLNDSTIRLESFILSNTPFAQVSWWERGIKKEELEANHVLFQMEDRATYVRKILDQALTSKG